MTARTLLTDPVSLTATIAGGLFVTTAVTTGVVGGVEAAAPSFHETSTVSVSASAQDRQPAAARDATRTVQEDPTHVPDLTGTTSTEHTPPGQAKRKGSAPPGLAKSDGVPPGLAKSDGVPPGQAKKNNAPPGQAKKNNAPPGQATKDVPPGQAKKDGEGRGHTPPGQARSRSTSTS